MNPGGNGDSARGRLTDFFGRMESHYGPTGWWPGETAFEIAIGAILTQNTAWRNVERAIENLNRAKLLRPRALLETPDEKLHELLTPAGYFRVKSRRVQSFCRFLVERYDGSMERLARRPLEPLREELLAVHGIGPETADDILLYACPHPVFVVDAYTRRILTRHGLSIGNKPYETLRAWFEKHLEPDIGLYREFHALIVYTGKDFCRGRPNCEGCPLQPTLRRGQPNE